VLTGGELPAMVLADCVARLLPGVLGCEESAQGESFSADIGGLLEYPHYTRPREFQGLEVPEVLLGGNHAEIEAWRFEQSYRITLARRPELLEGMALDKRQRKIAERVRAELAANQGDCQSGACSS
jgi:tRNA (guanine37-N1)-methyltransferase